VHPGGRLAILAAANAHELGGFVRAAARPGSRLVSDDFKGYAGLHGAYQHHPVVQGEGKNAERLMPIVHVLFSNVKTSLTASTGAHASPTWLTSCSSAPWPNRRSPIGS
jgi:hypothetical protein